MKDNKSKKTSQDHGQQLDGEQLRGLFASYLSFFILFRLEMGANRTRLRELADSQPILLIRIDSQFAKTNLWVGESINAHN